MAKDNHILYISTIVMFCSTDRETQTGALFNNENQVYQSVRMYLNEEECLEEKVKEHVCNDLTNAGERLCFTSRHFKC